MLVQPKSSKTAKSKYSCDLVDLGEYYTILKNIYSIYVCTYSKFKKIQLRLNNSKKSSKIIVENHLIIVTYCLFLFNPSEDW